MSFYKFNKNDVVRNTLVAHPKIHFKIYKNDIFYNNIKLTTDVEDGYPSIFDFNIDGLCDAGTLDFSCEDSSAYIAVI
jgi:hypothetical protein